MNSPKPDEVSIFHVARLITGPEEAPLHLACGGDHDLRARLEVLCTQ